MFPIFVASKGRSDTSQTLAVLKASNLSYLFFVEPQDYTKYCLVLGAQKVIMLNDNNQGLAFVRQFILDYAIANKLGWYWMLDDDITGFFKSVMSKNVRIPMADALERAEAYFKDSSQIAQASLEYQQYSWSAKKQFTINGYCDVCVAIHAQRAKLLKFRKETDLKVDRDFTLQVIARGFQTIRTCKIAFAAPKNGSNKGGLQDIYKQDGRELACSKVMSDIWGDKICKLVTKDDGRSDVSINWKFFKP